MGQWWGTHLSIQETQVPSLGRSHMLGATKHVCHNYWACVLKSRSHNYWAHMWHQLLKPWHPRTHVRQQERSPGWDTHGLQVESSPFLPQLEKSPRSKEDPAQAKLHKQKLLKKKKKRIWTDESPDCVLVSYIFKDVTFDKHLFAEYCFFFIKPTR